MTTVIPSDLADSRLRRRWPFFLRRLHSLTGIMFGAYLIVHLVINATLAQGNTPRDFYQGHVGRIHAVPFLAGVEWVFIFVPILYHAIYGTWLTFTAKWNVDHYPYLKNWLYVCQRISGFILALFILFHVLSLKGVFGGRLAFDPNRATLSIVSHVNATWALAYLVYPIGILASAYHTANGFWTAGITWGLTISTGGQRRWGYVCAGVGVVLLACGLMALIAAVHDASHLVARK
ncbi:MAG TPA: hypothetical protein VFE47_08545 [Tepidisphaeraceae bacterium]|nr:hypothetical protein [Tepidisphaeraceae bacterium]